VTGDAGAGADDGAVAIVGAEAFGKNSDGMIAIAQVPNDHQNDVAKAAASSVTMCGGSVTPDVDPSALGMWGSRLVI